MRKLFVKSPRKSQTGKLTNIWNKLCSIGRMGSRPGGAQKTGHQIKKLMEQKIVKWPACLWLGKNGSLKTQNWHQQAGCRTFLVSYFKYSRIRSRPACASLTSSRIKNFMDQNMVNRPAWLWLGQKTFHQITNRDNNWRMTNDAWVCFKDGINFREVS